MSRIYDIAHEYVDRLAALNPLVATAIGVSGHDHEMTDFSPDGVEAGAALDRETLASLAAVEPEGERDRIAREAMREDLNLSLERHEAGLHFRSLNVLYCPVQSVRQTFDLMPRDTEQHWANIAARARLVPDGLASYRATLQEGIARGLTVARRQVRGVAEQAAVWAGSNDAPPFFDSLIEAYDEAGIANTALRSDLVAAAGNATTAYADMAAFLRDTYLPAAVVPDGVGLDRYQLDSRAYTGARLDLDETYAWGWDQVRWIQEEMTATAGRIVSGGTMSDAKTLLDTDPARAIEGVEPFRGWMQDLQDRTISDLDGTHFDIADPVKTVEVMIAPPGGALAMYYTGPSEDFSRPGRTWYPAGGKTRFPLWGEVSIAYHEGVPGHHFQIATTVSLTDQLSRFQRLIGGTSGYVEGWGLYAERLMGELGYLDNPDYYLGMLASQLFRAKRVAVDIGMHLGLRIPGDADFHPGETWTPDLALEFMKIDAPFDPAFMASEIDRYLGLPGQAISYKVGERAWLAARDEAKQRAGAAFDLKAWHNRALDLGPMGLDQMSREMTAL